MLERVVSGGQTGADQAGWRAAKEVGLPTGGFMPRGFLTETGPRPDFAEMYGAVELDSPEYPPRTWANVEASDGTIWLGSIDSRGYRTRHDAAVRRSPSYPFLICYRGVTTPSEVAAWIEANRIGVLNVAGNRESVNPGIGERAERFLVAVFHQLARG
jgi:hypothetical protein